MTIEVGARIGRYVLKTLLGVGGFGAVYLAVDATGRRLAVKVLRPDHDQDTRTRFQREAAIMRGMSHPNVMPILDASGPEEDVQWLAMPWMPGGSLASLIPNNRSWEEVVELMRQAASGLAEYHAKGGIHRDIKPENLLLDDDGTVRVSDFGVARCPELAGSTMTRSAIGTEAYMAPEVWRNEACQGSDIYALGIVFWELVNDERHTTPAKPPRLLGSGPDFATMQALYARMTAELPENRPSATQVIRELDAFLEFLRKEPDPPGVAFWHGAVAAFMVAVPAALAAVVVVTVVGGGWAAWRAMRST